MKTKFNKIAVMGVMGALLLVPIAASANFVLNGGFESPIVPTYNGPNGPITDWIATGDVGVWNPSTYPPAILTAPEGVQVGYINSGTVSQILASTLQANTTYDLSIEVGGRADAGGAYNPGTAYSIQLWAGATLLSSVTPVAPPTSAWTTLLASFTSGAVVAPGQSLEIIISSPVSQLDFDNVELTATAVPEATTMIAGALLLLPFGASTLRILNRRPAV